MDFEIQFVCMYKVMAYVQLAHAPSILGSVPLRISMTGGIIFAKQISYLGIFLRSLSNWLQSLMTLIVVHVQTLGVKATPIL